MLHLGHVPLAVVEMVAVGVTAVVAVPGAAVATVVLATVGTGGGKSAGVDKVWFENGINIYKVVRLRLHASRPSAHVKTMVRVRVMSSSLPHLSTQAPSDAQQLRLPSLNVPHLGHARLVVTVGVVAVVAGSGKSGFDRV